MQEEEHVANQTAQQHTTITHQKLIERLNEDLAREYQWSSLTSSISQVFKGAEYMSIAAELEKHAGEESSHALKISKHIDYLGGCRPSRRSQSCSPRMRA